MKQIGVTVWLVLLITIVGVFFWYNEGIYQLPTPVPSDYHPVAEGTRILLKGALANYQGKPLFLHFFNPDCPCSRFNLRNFKALAARYRGRVQFVIIAVTKKKDTPIAIKKKFDLEIPVITDDAIAATCGVYSTPQAVLLDGQGRLYYRGNYNSSRYCTDERTAYANLALISFLNKQKLKPGRLALTAYGCRLPECDR